MIYTTHKQLTTVNVSPGGLMVATFFHPKYFIIAILMMLSTDSGGTIRKNMGYLVRSDKRGEKAP